MIGFTARLLEDEPDAPKYINTPQTVTYDKSRQVFGLHLAKEAIRKQGFVVVAEGNWTSSPAGRPAWPMWWPAPARP
jgi:DNA primase